MTVRWLRRYPSLLCEPEWLIGSQKGILENLVWAIKLRPWGWRRHGHVAPPRIRHRCLLSALWTVTPRRQTIDSWRCVEFAQCSSALPFIRVTGGWIGSNPFHPLTKPTKASGKRDRDFCQDYLFHSVSANDDFEWARRKGQPLHLDIYLCAALTTTKRAHHQGVITMSFFFFFLYKICRNVKKEFARVREHP